MPTPPAPCPCGTGLPYTDCCARFHAGPLHLLAPTAEALMRSRYSAYTLQLDDYLLATWHPSTRPDGPLQHEPGLRWLGLQVLRHETLDADHARVEFVARSKLGGRAHRLRELSRFVREGGRWFYVDAAAD
ncbi:MAG: YchJ family metal-binding protein [Pseudomonadota bacterium]|nr:YchJ family metal-binding protein [Pseudomonadota bacterium]